MNTGTGPRVSRRRPAAPPLAVLAALAVLLGAAPLPGLAQNEQAQGGQEGSVTREDLFEGRGEFEMVLIHGLGSNAAVWDQALPFLKGTFKVRTFELAGHGQTPPVLSPSIGEEAERLGEFIKAEGLAYPTLVGHGLGGMIALQYTLDHPADVHRLVLIDTAPKQLIGGEQKSEVAKALMEDYDTFVASYFLRLSPNPEVADRIVDTALRTDSASLISLLMSSFDFDVTARLAGLTVPLLVIGSEMMFPEDATSKLVLNEVGFGQTRSLTFKRMPKSGHFVMLETPVHLASVLLAFGVSPDYQFE